jgi:hypothetical protein
MHVSPSQEFEGSHVRVVAACHLYISLTFASICNATPTSRLLMVMMVIMMIVMMIMGMMMMMMKITMMPMLMLMMMIMMMTIMMKV